MPKVMYLEKEVEHEDVLIIIQPVDKEYKVSAYVWDLKTRECRKFQFEPESFDVAIEIAARFVGNDVDQLVEPS